MVAEAPEGAERKGGGGIGGPRGRRDPGPAEAPGKGTPKEGVEKGFTRRETRR